MPHDAVRTILKLLVRSRTPDGPSIDASSAGISPHRAVARSGRNGFAFAASTHGARMHNGHDRMLSKVPEVTLGFWIIKIAATTFGETGGDSVTMTLNWGYTAGTAIFLSLLVALVAAQ